MLLKEGQIFTALFFILLICGFEIAQNHKISSTLAESISRVDIEALGATVLRSATVLHTDDV